MDAGYVAGVFGLIGAGIGSASSIVAMVIQAKMRDRRDRAKQLIDMSMAEFKVHLDLATAGQGPAAVMPPSAFMYQNDLMLQAIENGTYTTERAREISALADKMFAMHWEVDQQRRGKSPKPE